MLFSEPKIPQCDDIEFVEYETFEFQCSSASRKFLNHSSSAANSASVSVSVLFSEPKIPQFIRKPNPGVACDRFSALQRAENSSINCFRVTRITVFEFQCSSASRKFLNWRRRMSASRWCGVSVLFSEPKIPQYGRGKRKAPQLFTGFSALQRAENSSIIRDSR